MRAMIRAILRDERGTTMMSWVGMTVCVFVLIIGIWEALYGGAGRSLKATIQGQVSRFAHGFEGGLGSSGAPSNMPRVGRPEMPIIDQPTIDQPTISTTSVEGPVVPLVTIDQPVVDQPVVADPTVAAFSIARLLPPEMPILPVLSIPSLLIPDTPIPPLPVIGLSVLAMTLATLRAPTKRVAAKVRDLLPQILRIGANERGINIVEYVGVTGIALMVAGFIVVGVTGYRFLIGGSMADVLDNQIASFENGRGGTVNYNTRLWRIGEPQVGRPELAQVDELEEIVQPHIEQVYVDMPYVPALSIPALIPFDSPMPDAPTIGIAALGVSAALLARRRQRIED